MNHGGSCLLRVQGPETRCGACLPRIFAVKCCRHNRGSIFNRKSDCWHPTHVTTCGGDVLYCLCLRAPITEVTPLVPTLYAWRMVNQQERNWTRSSGALLNGLKSILHFSGWPWQCPCNAWLAHTAVLTYTRTYNRPITLPGLQSGLYNQ